MHTESWWRKKLENIHFQVKGVGDTVFGWILGSELVRVGRN